MSWVRCCVCDAQIEKRSDHLRAAKKAQKTESPHFFCGRPKDCFRVFMARRPIVVDHQIAVGEWIAGGRKGPRPRSPIAPKVGSEQQLGTAARWKRRMRVLAKIKAINKMKSLIRLQQAATVDPREPPPPPPPTRFVEDLDPAEDPRFGRRRKAQA